jgi:hypothetical protein
LQTEFHSIISLNESIREIHSLSLEIRIQALNSLLAIKNVRSENVGFSAVSFELIHYSKEMEIYSEKLSAEIFSILHLATELKKKRRSFSLLDRARAKDQGQGLFFKNLLSNKKEDLIEIESKLGDRLTALRVSILQTLKFCKNGNYISMCTKVESAHISENKEFFRALAETVEKCVSNIYHSLQGMNRKLIGFT